MNKSFFARTKVKLFLCFALAVILTIIIHSRETAVTRNTPESRPSRDVESYSQNFRLENTEISFSDIFGMDDISGRVKIAIFYKDLNP